jgi:hypothetical protein
MNNYEVTQSLHFFKMMSFEGTKSFHSPRMKGVEATYKSSKEWFWRKTESFIDIFLREGIIDSCLLNRLKTGQNSSLFFSYL